MKVIITGGAGFIGSHFCEYLLSKGFQVFCVDDLSSGKKDNISNSLNKKNFQFFNTQISNIEKYKKALIECEIIFHFAAVVGIKQVIENPLRTVETNVEGTKKILDFAKDLGKKIIFTSSSEVYGNNGVRPLREDSKITYGPINELRWIYAHTKAIDEYLLLSYKQSHHLPIIITRLFNIIGPRQSSDIGMVIPRFIKQAIKNKDITIFGDGTQTRCFLDIRDLCEYLFLLISNPIAEGEIVNIGSVSLISILELAEKIIQLTNSTSKIKFLPYENAYKIGFVDVNHRQPDVNKLMKLTNYEPKYSLDQSLINIIDKTEK